MSYAVVSHATALTRSATAPTPTVLTLCAWIIPRGRTANQALLAIDQSGQTHYDYLETDSNGTSLLVIYDAGSTGVATLTTNTPYFVAITTSADGGTLLGYAGIAAANPIPVSGNGTTASFDPATLWVGSNYNGGEYANIEFYNVKIFQATLTEPQLRAERDSYTPVLTPWAWYPLVSDVNDASGNAQHLGAVTTLGSFTATPAGAPAPTGGLAYELEGYLWRRDDGTEVTASTIGAQDTPL